MNIANGRRRWATPRAVIDAVRPELIDAHFPSSGVEDRHSRLIDMDPGVAMDETELTVVKALEPPGGPLDPADHGLAIEPQPVSGEHLCLSVERQIPGKALRHDPGDEGCRRLPALEPPVGRWRLPDPSFTVTACIFRADRGDDAQHGRDNVERLADIFADAVHVALTAGALPAFRLNDPRHAREVFGQAANVAVGSTGPALRRAIVVGRLTNASLFQIAQIEACLIVQDDACLLRPRAKKHRLVAV